MIGIVITAARRTPVGNFLGAFAALPARELGRPQSSSPRLGVAMCVDRD